MALSVRLSCEDELLFRKYAEMKKISVSDLIRQAVMERIEDEIDLKLYEQAMTEFRKNPVTYTLEEVEKELGIS